MAMSASLHAHNIPQFDSNGNVTNIHGEDYAVINIQSGGGYESDTVTLFLSEEQLTDLKRTLQSTSIQFKKVNAKKQTI